MSEMLDAAISALSEKLGDGFDGSAKFVFNGQGSIVVDGHVDKRGTLLVACKGLDINNLDIRIWKAVGIIKEDADLKFFTLTEGIAVVGRRCRIVVDAVVEEVTLAGLEGVMDIKP